MSSESKPSRSEDALEPECDSRSMRTAPSSTAKSEREEDRRVDESRGTRGSALGRRSSSGTNVERTTRANEKSLERTTRTNELSLERATHANEKSLERTTRANGKRFVRARIPGDRASLERDYRSSREPMLVCESRSGAEEMLGREDRSGLDAKLAGEPCAHDEAKSPRERRRRADSSSESRSTQGHEGPSKREDGSHDEGRLDGSARSSDVRTRQLLSGGTPRELLCRIVQGDPLGMRERVARLVHSSAYLLDADRAQLRSLARCARFASRGAGRADLASWLDEIVSEAIDQIVCEEADLELDPAGETLDAAFVALAPPLGLEPESMRRACAAFNQLPAADRRAFFALVIDGRALDDLAHESGESASEIARRARRALDLLMQGQAPERAQAASEKKSDKKAIDRDSPGVESEART
jgi:hypothetical protein